MNSQSGLQNLRLVWSRGLPWIPVALALTAHPIVSAALQQPQQVTPSHVSPPAADIAAALQRRYDAIRDFSADFTQTYEGAVLRRKATESGTVQIKKPGKMRWDYTSPEKKQFISDGRTMYMYFPADKQVMTNPVPEQDQATSAVLFLMGKGDIARDFNARFAGGQVDDSVYRLRLEPKLRQAEYDWLQATIDSKTLQFRELSWGDAQGGRNTIAFSNFKENTGLPDKIFQFSIPRGTEVITSGKTP
jgi:outer membrane lipoprotein carrier protein